MLGSRLPFDVTGTASLDEWTARAESWCRLERRRGRSTYLRSRIARGKERKIERKKGKENGTPVSPPSLPGERLWRRPGSYCCFPRRGGVRKGSAVRGPKGERLSRSILIAQDRSVRRDDYVQRRRQQADRVDERGRWLNRDAVRGEGERERAGRGCDRDRAA